MKRLAIIFLTLLITINILPVTIGNFVFADSVPDGYSPAGANDQVDAFRYYCKSRNLAIEGSVLDAVTQVTTKAYQTAVASAGFDMNELQNEIYKNTGVAQNFFFTATGITAMNRIFAEFLQNNDLAVGDEVDNKVLESGRWFVDADGIGCWLYVGTDNTSGFVRYDTEGTSYKYTGLELRDLVFNNSPSSISFHLRDNYTYSQTLYHYVSGSNYAINPTNSWSSNKSYFSQAGSWWKSCDPVIYFDSSRNRLFLGYKNVLSYNGVYPSTVSPSSIDNYIYKIVELPSDLQSSATNVYITTNNNTINNNTYEGDTIINNEGDIINNPKPPKPIPDPNDDHSTTTDPVNPDDPDGDSNISFPFFDLDLPSIDWSIGDLSHKFPFSIPFDLYNMFSVLNTEPQTPEIKGNIDLGIYEWDIDWDLHQFDDTAELLRNIEFVGFIIGLIFITRSLIKG